jgi:dTMP kinase
MVGKLITFEGVEGAGKTTQLQQTAAWLETLYEGKRSIFVTREPGGTELGAKIRQLLLYDLEVPIDYRAELLLYGADRAQHVAEKIVPQIELGNIVLCDRFTDSTIAYQGYGRGFDLDEIDRVNRLATNGLQPDLTIWLDLDVEIGLQRAADRGSGRDRIEGAALEFHQRVRSGFRSLAKLYPDRVFKIDAHRCAEEIQAEIRHTLIPLLGVNS